MLGIKRNDYFSIRNDGMTSSNFDVELMQFTGLKDKNGFDIYEGDIVAMYDRYNKNWTNSGAQVVFVNSYVGGWVLKGAEGGEVSLGARNFNEIKVIGNMHESPELQA